MKTKLAAFVVLVALVGCDRKADRDTGMTADGDRSGVDTVIKSSSIKDTTIVQADTSIDVDTLKKTDHIDDKAR